MDINTLITRLRDIAWDFPPEHSINRAADMLTVLQAENNKLQDELRRREAKIARLNEAREIANEKAREYEKRAGLVEQVKKERDAAVKEIFQWVGCPACKYWNSEDEWCEKHDRSADSVDSCSTPEWRGMEEQNE